MSTTFSSKAAPRRVLTFSFPKAGHQLPLREIEHQGWSTCHWALNSIVSSRQKLERAGMAERWDGPANSAGDEKPCLRRPACRGVPPSISAFGLIWYTVRKRGRGPTIPSAEVVECRCPRHGQREITNGESHGFH